jgi:hypothetical protein
MELLPLDRAVLMGDPFLFRLAVFPLTVTLAVGLARCPGRAGRLA